MTNITKYLVPLRRCRTLALSALLMSALLSSSVLAASGNPLKGDEKSWRFTLAFPMIWAPDIDGRIRGDQRSDFTIPFSDILDGLHFGLMGELYATRGPFGLAARFNYLNLKTDRVKDGLISTDIELDLVAGVNDFLASWRVHEKVRLLAGVRHVHNKLTLDVVSRIGETEIVNERIKVSDADDFDLLFGMTFDHWFNEHWGLMINGDIGLLGDNDRDYSAEFRGLYRFGKLNNVWFGWRYLRIGNDTTEDGQRYEVDMTQQGPMLGWAFTF